MNALKQRVEWELKRYGGTLYAPLKGYDYKSRYDGRFECMEKFIKKEHVNVLDIGSYHGAISLQMAELGKEVVSLEKSSKKIGALREYCRTNGNKFIVVHGDMFKYIDKNWKFDTVISFNIFHHFIKTKDEYVKLKKMLRKLETKDMFLQFGPFEEMKKGQYKRFQQDEFAQFVMALVRLNSWEKIGTVNGGHLYYVSYK